MCFAIVYAYCFDYAKKFSERIRTHWTEKDNHSKIKKTTEVRLC